jgi:hypothetical protein
VIPLATAGAKSLFLGSIGPLLLNHPLTNIWRAIQNLDTLRLALIQKTNSVNVDDANFLEIQSRRLSALLDLGAETSEVRRSKCT